MPRAHFMLLFLISIAMLVAQSGCAHFAREQLYAPPVGPITMPEWDGAAPQRVFVTTEDGLDLAGLYWPATNGNQDVILVLHGRRDNAGRMAGYVQRIAGSGRGVLVASYRGFNDNPGSPTEAGLVADAQAFYRFAREQAGSTGDIYVFGHSLGGAVAIQLAARETLAGVITLATFSDLDEAAPYFSEIFIPDSWASIATLGRVTEPILFIHGADDDYVEPAHSRRLYATSCSLAALAIIAGVRHRPNIRLVEPLLVGWIDALENGQAREVSIEGTASWESKDACATR
jgi:uncharacterized protein